MLQVEEPSLPVVHALVGVQAQGYCGPRVGQLDQLPAFSPGQEDLRLVGHFPHYLVTQTGLVLFSPFATVGGSQAAHRLTEAGWWNTVPFVMVASSMQTSSLSLTPSPSSSSRHATPTSQKLMSWHVCFTFLGFLGLLLIWIAHQRTIVFKVFNFVVINIVIAGITKSIFVSIHLITIGQLVAVIKLIHHTVRIQVFTLLLAPIQYKVSIGVSCLVIGHRELADIFTVFLVLIGHSGTFIFLVLCTITINIVVASISFAIVIKVHLILIEFLWTVVADITKAVMISVLLVLVVCIRAVVTVLPAVQVVNVIIINVCVAAGDRLREYNTLKKED